jgi:hypothetical protein
MSQVAFVVSSIIRQNRGQSGSFQVPLELFQEHWESIKKFGFRPLRSKTLVYPGFFAFLAICFGFHACPCTPMPAGAAPVEFIVLCAALDPTNISVSRLESRQSRPRTLVFPGKTCGFVAEMQDSN